MNHLEVKDLSYSIGQTTLIKEICLSITKGSFVGLVGPNGCGKSTLLKNIYRVYQPDQGIVLINGTNIRDLSSRDAAKQMSVMVQESNVEFDMYVLDMVLLGRYAHKRLLSDTTKEDIRIARDSLKAVGMEGYEDRSFSSLSGGEKQRVLVARALTQQADIILLDEPTNHLDIGYQYQIMNILKAQNITVFSSIHDLNLAAYYCDRLVLMNHGKIIRYGPPEEVFTKEILNELFAIDSDISIDPRTGKIRIFYYPIL